MGTSSVSEFPDDGSAEKRNVDDGNDGAFRSTYMGRASSSADPVRQYLREIGRVSLLNAEGEVALGPAPVAAGEVTSRIRITSVCPARQSTPSGIPGAPPSRCDRGGASQKMFRISDHR